MVKRNNQERLGASQDSSGDIAAAAEAVGHALKQATETSSPLSFVSPTEFIELPSRGKFYPPGHPLLGKDVIEIKYMTAKHEDILTSPTLLKKGIAIERLIQDLIVDKNIKLDELLVGDKNALLVGARLTGYGPEYEANVTCVACGSTQKHKFDLTKLDHVYPEEEQLKKYNIEFTEKNTFLITLPKTKVTVEARILNGKDEKNMAYMVKKREKHGFGTAEVSMTDQMKMTIIAINKVTDKAAISNFIDNMPAFDSKFYRLCYAAVTPNVDMVQEFSCKSCGHEEEVNVPLTADFFWPE
tara:strand:- start:17303 stop:18199 length:897 start_codon:yes stop_codon:yes gene_type:complete